MLITNNSFKIHFEVFKERIHKASGVPFVSFKRGLPESWEGYKGVLRDFALARLDIASIVSEDIGSGKILNRIIDSIEIQANAKSETNNLVRWQNRYGHANRSHHTFLDARTDVNLTRKIELWALRFYHNLDAPSEAFKEIQEIVGSRYDLLAYLFFLKDWTQFMPIATVSFDRAFSMLGVDLVTRQKCSWTNYQQYNSVLEEIRNHLSKVMAVPDIRLVDAHSFCWLLVRPELDSIIAADVNKKTQKISTKIYNALEKSVVDMAIGIMGTVAQSNGQRVLTTLKNKNTDLNQQQLETLIQHLFEKQEYKCALTGIPLQLKYEFDDEHLIASPDRIDSSGDYTKENIQLVCRFINKWKSSTNNDEFLRLLALVRSDEP